VEKNLSLGPFFSRENWKNVTLPKERKKALKEDDERERERENK